MCGRLLLPLTQTTTRKGRSPAKEGGPSPVPKGERRVLTVEQRFWAKVAAPDENGCARWMGATYGSGYGAFYAGGGRAGRVQTHAHRFAYEMCVGPIPAGLHLDHLCRVRDCVAPAHLEPVTPGENVRRGDAPAVTARRHAAVTRCPQGHEYTPENTYTYSDCRTCRACVFARTAARRARLKEQRKP